MAISYNMLYCLLPGLSVWHKANIKVRTWDADKLNYFIPEYTLTDTLHYYLYSTFLILILTTFIYSYLSGTYISGMVYCLINLFYFLFRNIINYTIFLNYCFKYLF